MRSIGVIPPADHVLCRRTTGTDIARVEKRGETPGRDDGIIRCGRYWAGPARSRRKYWRPALPCRSGDRTKPAPLPDDEKKRSDDILGCVERSTPGSAHRISSWEKIHQDGFPVHNERNVRITIAGRAAEQRG